MATASAKFLFPIRLWERRHLGGRVDHEKGIVFGVKVVGRSSPNTHGVRGVNGTDYTLEALRQSAPLYEGVNCNVDHPPRNKPNQERSATDRFAWLEDIEVRESGTYGNLHFLDPNDPLAVKIMNAAERHPEAFALSHNAQGKGDVKNGRFVIHEIVEVISVDIVADGGTNRSLFESAGHDVSDERRDDSGKWTGGGGHAEHLAHAYDNAAKLSDEDHDAAMKAAEAASESDLKTALGKMGFTPVGDVRKQVKDMISRRRDANKRSKLLGDEKYGPGAKSKRKIGESRSPNMKRRVHEVLKNNVLDALTTGRRKRLQHLLETSLSEARSPLMEASDGDDHRDHMYKAMRACEDAGNEEAAAGIHKLLHPDKRVEEEEAESSKEHEEEEEGGEKEERHEMEGQGEEGPGEPGSHNEGPDGKGGPATAWESRHRKKSSRQGEIMITEARAMSMCRLAGVEATATLMEAITGSRYDQAAAMIEEVKRQREIGRRASPPRSTTPLRESAGSKPIPKDLKDWAESLRG